MLKDNRVDFALPADYREGKGLDIAVKAVLYRIAVLRDLEELQKAEYKKIKD